MPQLLRKFYSRVLWEYGVPGHCYEPSGPYITKVRAVRAILGTKSNMFSVGVSPCQGCPLNPPILFVIFMDRISRRSQGEESVWFGDLRIVNLLFADDVVLWASSDCDLQHSLGQFTVECEAVRM